jgi:hypothetical protein
MKNTAGVAGGKDIAVLLQSISGVSAINPLVASYVIHGGNNAVIPSLPDFNGKMSLNYYKCYKLRLSIFIINYVLLSLMFKLVILQT